MNADAATRRPSARLWRIAAGVVAGLLIAAALAITALRLALIYLPGHAARLQAWIERETSMHIEYSRLDARLRWYGPEIVLRDVRVLDRDGSQALFVTREGSVGLDLWNFFRTGQLVAGRVRFLAPTITVVCLADGRVRLLGQSDQPTDRPPFDLDRLPAGRLVIENATVVYRDLKRGLPPLVLHDLDIVLRRDRGFIVAEGAAQLPETLGERLEFSARLKGSLDDLRHLDARLELRSNRLLLAGLRDRLPNYIARPLGGHGRARIVVVTAAGAITHARLQFDLSNVRMQLPARVVPAIEAVRVSPLRIEQQEGKMPYATVTRTDVNRPAAALPAEARYVVLKGDVRLRNEGGIWSFQANDLHADPATDRGTPAARIVGTFRGTLRSAFDLDVSADAVDLPRLWPLALAFAPRPFDRWAGLDPAGRVNTLRLKVSRKDAATTPTFSASADVIGLGMQPTARLPGVSGITASLQGADQQGVLQLRAIAPALDWPRIFRAPIKLTSVTANVAWRRDGEAYVFSAHDVQLRHAKAKARLDAQFTYLNAGVSPVLKLAANVEDIDVTIVPGILPVGRMRERAIAWLDGAFKQGHAGNAKLLYRGPVKKFPFRHGEGEFTASVDAKNITLAYAPGFAPLVGATGRAEFHNATIGAKVSSGRIAALQLTGADFLLADYKFPVLDLQGGGAGDLGQALEYVQASPLGARLGSVFMDLTASGPALYHLKLLLPVMAPDAHPPAGTPRTIDYLVNADLQSVTVASPILRAPAQRVVGRFELHNQELRVPTARGSILDGPFELTAVPGRTSREVPMAVDFTGRGTAAGARLPAFIGLPGGIRMAGTMAWELRGHVEKRLAEARWPVQINVNSTLAGLEILAPKPFAKAPAETRATKVRLDVPGTHANDVSLESGAARARLRFAERGGKWQFDRGAARFDGQPVALPAQAGLAVSGDWPHFDLAEWLALRNGDGTAVGGGRGSRLSDWLGPVDVHLDRATVLGYPFADLLARMRLDGDTWRINVGGPQAQGVVGVPDDIGGNDPITLDMKRLYLAPEALPKGIAVRASPPETDPRTLPAITATVDDFSWHSRRFGRLQAVIAREPRGLAFQTLTATAPEFSITGQGSWFMEGNGSRTRVQLEIDSTDLAATERALGYRDSVDARKAHFAANLTWMGGPSSDVLGKLNGTLKLAIEDGQLRDVEPGAGRMLGLLSVAQLRRRLALDFRDVTDKGLAFDKVRGDFELRNGNAHTQNLLVKGPAVDIGVAGRTGLAAEDYDQTIVVSGNPGGPLIVAGALAAGPVVGAGVLLLSQLFKGQLQGLTRAYYHVTGPWSAPVVERMSGPSSENVAGDAVISPAAGGQP